MAASPPAPPSLEAQRTQRFTEAYRYTGRYLANLSPFVSLRFASPHASLPAYRQAGRNKERGGTQRDLRVTLRSFAPLLLCG